MTGPRLFADQSGGVWTPFEGLLRRRGQVEREITKRIREARSSIGRKLADLERYGELRRPRKFRRRLGKQGKARIKYRGPELGETWSGRGHMPCWMTAYIEQGKKKEQFLMQ
jgi:DNA-binding protein H-NS